MKKLFIKTLSNADTSEDDWFDAVLIVLPENSYARGYFNGISGCWNASEREYNNEFKEHCIEHVEYCKWF